ncbi:MAG: hypothetical protein AAFU77_13045 [Myxococcota bacterium]
MADDERPKKSWRDLDRKRDHSSHRKEERGGGSPSDMRENSREYRAYKSQLDKMFDGGGLPEALREKLGDTATGAKAKQRKELLKNLTDAIKSRDVIKALRAYRADFGFPEDEAALAKLVDLDDDEIVLETLQTFERLLDEGMIKRATSFKVRLKTVKMTVDDPQVLTLADRLLKKL